MVGVKTHIIAAGLLLALGLLFTPAPVRAETPADGGASSGLDLSALAQRARDRQSAIDAELARFDSGQVPAGVDVAAERTRLQDLRDRNSRLLQEYDSRISSSGRPAAPSSTGATGPAAPESSGGGAFAGIMDKASGFMSSLTGGGSSAAGGPAGPISVSGPGGAGGGIMDYLKANWPGLLGSTVGSIGGYALGSRIGGGKLGGIVGSLVGGWLGQKLGNFVQDRFMGGKPGGGAPQGAQPNPYYSGTNPGQQATGGGQFAPGSLGSVPQTGDIAVAQRLMTEKYQAFMAMSGPNVDPNLRTVSYQNYIQAKQQYEQLRYAQAGAGYR